MPNEKQPLNEGYVPEREERGYQPQQQGHPPTGDGQRDKMHIPVIERIPMFPSGLIFLIRILFFIPH